MAIKRARQLLAYQLSSSHSVPHCLMESVGALDSPIGASFNLLSLPATFPSDEDEESLGLEGIKPKSSPIPRRRSSESSDDSPPPASSSRRVSFADAFGLSLVSVKQFDAQGVTAPSGPLESDLNEDKEYYILPLFTLPQSVEELDLRVHEQKLELESLELLSGTSTLRGIVCVLDVCLEKMVYVRTSLDSWRSHFDLLADPNVAATNNEEFPGINLKVTSPQSLNSEKHEKESIELEEEISRIRSRRSKRRAVRLAKVKKHFAKRETKTKESEVTAETSMQEHASVLEKTSCSPDSSQTAQPPTCNQISPSDESSKFAEDSGYSADIYSQALTQNEGMINTKTNLSTAHTHLPLEDCGESIACSASEALEDGQLTEDLTDQKVSIQQSFPVCQNPDLPICKKVERAWEHFEKDTKQRIKGLSSKMDEDTNISARKPEENTSETESSSMIEFDGEHNTLVIKEEIQDMKNYESLDEGTGNQTKQIEKLEQEPKEQEGAGEGGMNIEDELKYIDDEEDLDAMETEREKTQQADEDDLLTVTERDSEEQKQIISTSNVKSLPHHIDFNEIEDLGGVEDSEKQDRHFNSGVEICEESWQESSPTSDTELSGSVRAMEKDWDVIEFIDKEESMCRGSENSDRDTTDDVNNMLENMDCQAKDSMIRDLENVDDNTSTESQIDDEMELYLISLRNSQQSVFREGTMSGSYGKRPSMSKGRPLAMPSISESVDEDQSNSSLEDLTNIEYIMEQERATQVIARNVLWWKEFLSYDNMIRSTEAFHVRVHRLAVRFRHVRWRGAIRRRVVAECACVLTD
ncbi:protein phosphatase 1 regulatory subunit 3A [Pimephales promelas]|nr:protein phosphatase 1 regulatory subunit 3A [Pimephales promelas]